MPMTLSQQEAVLNAAVEVFAERGYRGASFDAIAERVGLTRQGVLHYFPSKRALLLGVLRYRAQLSREHIAVDHADDDLPSLLAEVVAHEHENQALAQVQTVLMAESVNGDPVRFALRDHYRGLREHAERSLAERYGERLPSGATTRSAATALLAFLDGLQQLQWLLEDDEETDYPGIMREIIAVMLGSPPVPAEHAATTVQRTGVRS